MCVSEGECDKNMKDGLIWISEEHENDTATHRGKQGEARLPVRCQGAHVVRPLHHAAKYKTSHVNEMAELKLEATFDNQVR